MTNLLRDYGLERYRKGEDKMTEQIKFHERYYEDVKKYLNSHKELHPGNSFGVDGKLYLTNGRKKPSGFVLQRCCEEPSEIMLSVINYHPSFNQIKSDLQKIIESKNE